MELKDLIKYILIIIVLFMLFFEHTGIRKLIVIIVLSILAYILSDENLIISIFGLPRKKVIVEEIKKEKIKVKKIEKKRAKK